MRRYERKPDPVDENEPAFNDLVNSIKAHGVQEPLIVTPMFGKRRFRIVIGHRRRRAGIKAEKKGIPIIIRIYESPEAEEQVMLNESRKK